ncbi:hypothetical protein TNCV_4141731 [Trichonephila clavipes]|nr:hypothetical protein TNCV_4141731 [Trichonephila clavipes]
MPSCHSVHDLELAVQGIQAVDFSLYTVISVLKKNFRESSMNDVLENNTKAVGEGPHNVEPRSSCEGGT